MSPTASTVHLAILASAGTGKTFALTNRFIALLAGGVEPDRILAATFTRKAAGEILQRVMQRLGTAAGDRREAAELARHTSVPGLDAARCAQLLRRVVHESHRLRCGTFDSFFHQLAGGYAMELGLPPDWRVTDEDENALIQQQCISDLLVESDPIELVGCLRQLDAGGARRSVTERLSRLFNEMLGLYRSAPDRQAWDWIHRIARPLDHAQVVEMASRLANVDLPTTRSGTPRANWIKAVARNVEYLKNGEWGAFVGDTFIERFMAGEGFDRAEFPCEVTAVLEPLVRHALAILHNHLKDRTEAAWELMHRYDQIYQRRALESGRLRFDDVTHLLGQAKHAMRLDDMYFRLDGRIDHLLLDEFQDTSSSQWQVMQPLASEIASHGSGERSFFCVGDVKQAIYSWRGGEAEILQRIDELLGGGISQQSLTRSYRSAPPVIETVNKVFGDVQRNPALNEFGQAGEAWQQRFTPHQTARTDLPGYVELRTARKADYYRHQQHVTRADAVSAIADLAIAAPGLKIGVLVRTNREVRRMIYQLAQPEIGVIASEEGGNPLIDSPAVCTILSLLTLADHPGDTAARFHVAASPLGPIVGLTDHTDDQEAGRLAARLRRELLESGYGLTLFRLVRPFARNCDPRNARRLTQLVELGHEYDHRSTNRPSDFVDLVNQRKVDDPVSSDIRVMTIHQAKGLQFDIVVLPELHARLVDPSPVAYIDQPDPLGPIHRVCCRPLKAVVDKVPALQELRGQHEQRALLESLNLLYVAMTRAKHALLMIVPPSSSSESSLPKSFAGVIRGALCGPGKIDENQPAWSIGDPDWLQSLSTSTSTIGEVKQAEADGEPTHRAAPPKLLPCTRRRRILARQSPSSLAHDEAVDIAAMMRIDRAEARLRGRVIHQWFELIGWLDEDGPPADALLRTTALELGAPTGQLDPWIDQYHTMLQRPAVAERLRRSSVEGPAVLWRERPFVLRQDDAVINGVFDRVVLHGNEKAPVSAEVIDFKTDAVDADDPAALEAFTAQYRVQMQSYRLALAEITSLDPQAISATLLLVGAGCAVSV